MSLHEVHHAPRKSDVSGPIGAQFFMSSRAPVQGSSIQSASGLSPSSLGGTQEITLSFRTHADAAQPARTAEKAIAKAKGRWKALDFFRFAAVVLMVQGHTFTALLDTEVKAAAWYRWHAFVHGLTAPMFLFAAGLAFGVTTFRKWDAHHSGGAAMGKRLKRYGWILFVAYVLHLPGLSLWRLFGENAEAAQRSFFQVDALHHIATVLVASVLWVRFAPSKRAFVTGIALAAAAVVLSGPFMWRTSFEGVVPAPLAAYLNADTGSLFPIVPWAGFVLSGILTARFIGNPTGHRPFVLGGGLMLVGASLVGVSIALRDSGFDPFGEYNYWKTGPYFFMWRLGVVMMALAVLCGVERLLARRSSTQTGLAGRTVETMGQESLIVYVVHLLVLYGSVAAPGLTSLFKGSLSPVSAGLVFAVFFAAMAAVAFAWKTARTDHPVYFDRFRFGLLAVVVLLMITPH